MITSPNFKSISKWMSGISYRMVSLLSLVVILAIMFTFAYINPTDVGDYVRCPVNQFLGLQCPGCGSLRAVHSMLHGNFRQSFVYNGLATMMLPILLIHTVAGIITGKDLFQVFRHFGIISRWFIVAVVLFTVLRNVV